MILKTRSQKIPVILLGGLAFVAFSLFNDNHRVRDVDVPIKTVNRPTVEDALRRWEKGRSDSEPLVLVATAGGASRAAYWTGTVLRALDDRSKGQFSDHVFAISSVSGGALGAIGYAAWLADRPMDSEAQPTAAQARLNFVQDFFGQDYLGPSVGALLFPDLIQRFLPLPLLPDRAASLRTGLAAKRRGMQAATLPQTDAFCRRVHQDLEQVAAARGRRQMGADRARERHPCRNRQADHHGAGANRYVGVRRYL
jgi:hypothetical protein